MNYIDTVEITICSGNGGSGAVSFRREKYTPKGGPDGGNGGTGGNIILRGNSKLRSLLDLKRKPSFKARNGQPGLPKKKSGTKGQDVIIDVPLGTMVFEKDTLLCDVTEHHQEICIAKGGLGGKGNAFFSTATNQAPRYAQPGLSGKTKQIKMELKLIAQVGLIGLPNAGKSTLLNTLTQAHPKIGAYPFTTLYPNLGTLLQYNQELIIADIPGLIEGSSKGQGLGNQFLRHIDRTEILVHLISSEDSPKNCIENYLTIRNELKESHYDLTQKPTIVVLSKIDLLLDKQLHELISLFKEKLNIIPITISSHTRQDIDTLIHTLYKVYNEHQKSIS